MSNGFLATNSGGQVLISSDTRNLHLIEKVSSPTYYDYNNLNYGGINIVRYRTSCAVTPVPFFTMPSDTSNYGITRISSVSEGVWDIELIKSSSNSDYPEMYVFADPRASTATEAYGLKVFRDDGTAAFDSRLRPLAVTGGLSIVHPSNPITALTYGLDPKFCGSSIATSGNAFAPAQYNQFFTYNITLTSKPMFYFPSLAQAQRQSYFAVAENECDGGSYKGNCIGAERDYFWSSTYWAFYRGTLRRGTNQVFAGWSAVDFGCNWTYTSNGAFLGVGSGSSGSTGGTWPYTNETLNLSAATVIIGDASRYD
jgi:hypothetical protein